MPEPDDTTADSDASGNGDTNATTNTESTLVMTPGRLEAFSDAVIAIAITIMVLELRVPHRATIHALRPLVPVFLSYVLSFVYLGIYWNNHHHLIKRTNEVTGGILWANLHLLFWLSLFPFVTSWMGDAGYTSDPVALYGAVALLAGGAYWLLVVELRRVPGQAGPVMEASGTDSKGLASLGLYAAGIAISLAGFPLLAFVLYIVVAIMWFIPDRRVERTLHHGS